MGLERNTHHGAGSRACLCLSLSLMSSAQQPQKGIDLAREAHPELQAASGARSTHSPKAGANLGLDNHQLRKAALLRAISSTRQN